MTTHSIPPHAVRLLFGAIVGAAGASSCLAAGSVSGRVVDTANQGIGQAIVFVQNPAPDSATSQSAVHAVATMDQINKTFVPSVLPIVAGTEVSFPNRDNIQHHVYSFSRAKNFELPLYKGHDAPPVLFDKPGIVKLGCNIHDWMSAIVLVVPNSYYATTDAKGNFTLPPLTSGTYQVVAWHPQSREKIEGIAQQVDLTDQNVTLTFKLSLSTARSRPATRGVRWEQ